MLNKYIYRQKVYGRRYTRFRHRLRQTIGWGLFVAIIAIIIFIDLRHRSVAPSGISKAQSYNVADNLITITSPYFKFADYGKWVLNTTNSTPDRYIYGKFHKLDPLAQLIIYVNRVPIPLDLATPHVLPVRIVNGNSFDVTQVSGACGKTYGNALHKVKVVSIDFADMLCDPDNTQYLVQLAAIGGSYDISLHRVDGSPVHFVVIYRDVTLDPNPKSLLQVAKTFQAL